MKLIALRGKHAVGAHTHAMVDDEDFERLNRWKWKAKPNGSGSHVYAVRNQKTSDGTWMTIRMHREVLGYSGPLDVDHINRNALDNTKVNLRIVTRRVNVNNTVWVNHELNCAYCRKDYIHRARLSARRSMYCSAQCAQAASRDKSSALANARAPTLKSCEWCGCAYQSVRPAQRFCCEPCLKAEKWKRQREAGCLPASANRVHRFSLDQANKGNRGPEAPPVSGPGKG